MSKLFLIAVLSIISSCKNKASKNSTTVEKNVVTLSANDSIIPIVKEEEKEEEENNVVDIIPEEKNIPTKKKEALKKPSTPKIKKEKPQIIIQKKQIVSTTIDTISSKTPKTKIERKPSETIKTPIIKKEIPKKATTKINHIIWNNLLTKYVSEKGNVDYKSFTANSNTLNAYLDYLANNTPKSNWSKNEKLAYYINIYNAGTVKLILDHYPTKSIKNLKKPWGKKIIKIGNELISLGDIEHKILRKVNEPRIHFAINCASYSCPKLLNKAFTAAKMEQQLEEVTYSFINDSTRNTITENSLELSEIFKWYKKDFPNNLLAYINKYTKTAIAPNAKISYNKYDWSLNERE